MALKTNRSLFGGKLFAKLFGMRNRFVKSFLFVVLLISNTAFAADYDYARLFDLAYKVMSQKDLYKAMNEAIPQQKELITQSQLVYLLQNNPKYFSALELIHKNLTEGPQVPILDPKAYLNFVKDELKKTAQTEEFLKTLQSYSDPAAPMDLNLTDGEPGYESLRLYVNHPRLKDIENPAAGTLPADDLRQLVLDFIKGAEQEIYFNVFDFDLKVVADALKNQHLDKGVKVLGGIDAGTIAARPEVGDIFRDLNFIANENFQVVAVNSVGLNHQKIIVRDPYGPNAAVLFLSGNFTQSCIGPEGDLVDISVEKRPVISIPNANHALVVEGELPAQLTRFELKKTLEHKIRGQSQYPVGGSFRIFGRKGQVQKSRPSITISFSPNGGSGDVNGSIYVPLIKRAQGGIEAVHFAFSSKQIQNALMEKAAQDISQKGRFDFRSTGDTPFAMREWSVFLALSGLKKDLTTGKYILDAESKMFSAMNVGNAKELQSNVRIAPEIYGDRYFKNEAGKSLHVTSKIHHKVFIFPEEEISILGTSFNPSENAESNNEQIVIVHDADITKEARRFFGYLFNESKRSVNDEANRRNKRVFTPQEPEKTPGTAEREN